LAEHGIVYGQEPEGRSVVSALWRGALMRCPACGKGRMFRAFLKVADECPRCGEALHHHRADDAPPYVTIFVVGHVVIAALLWAEVAFTPPLWLHAAIWFPLTLAMSLWLLPRVKGALVALQWALRMHGFDPASEDHASPTRP